MTQLPTTHTTNYLLIDVSSIFHRAYHALSKKFTALDISNKPCTGTYGFLTTLFRVINEVGPFDKFMFAIDAKGSTSVRKAQNPEYKAGRTAKPSSFYEDLNGLIHSYLPMFKIMPLGLSGYEADDIIASSVKYIASHHSENNTPYHIYILSGDGDLEQCIKYTHHISFIKTQPSWSIQSYQDILTKWGGVEAKHITKLKAIVGDGSDNIHGIKGYKLKKALKVLNDSNWLNLPENKQIIEQNISLLEFRDDLEAVPRPLDLSQANLEKIFLTLNSKALLNRLKKGTLITRQIA